jgi:hypothetical protein
VRTERGGRRVIRRSVKALFAGNNYFRAISKSTKKFFAVLPAKPELGDIGEAESADDIGEKIDIGFVKVGFHDRALCPINQLRLAEFAMQIFSNLISNDLAGDFHWVAATYGCLCPKSTGKSFAV